jgi:deaminated glutathione amidase
MKVAALQMVSAPDVQRNLVSADRLITEAAVAGAQLVVLPEYFCFMGAQDRDKLGIAEDAGRGPIQAFLSSQARMHGLWVIGGTLPIRGADERKVRNSCCVYAPDGQLAARYDKLHLFRYRNDAGEDYDEGRVLQAGDKPVAATVHAAGDDWRIALSICYDLRFPELYRRLMTPPCDLISMPAAFTYTTGRAHWELLLRARAVENQCYVIASAQGGRHENGRRTWGHSMVVDPWGEVLSVCEEGEGMALADIDKARMNTVRQQLPALAHRRC